MRLRDLSACFLHDVEPDGSCRHSQEIVGACGVMFQCPKCAEDLIRNRQATGCTEPGTAGEVGEEDGRRFVRGAHSVICWFVGKVPDELNPKPGRWTPQGTSIDDLTFVPPPSSVSVYLTGPGCGWHGHIVNGEATLT